MWLGPDSNGAFKKVVIKSIQDKRTDVSNAFAGQNVCLALRNIDRHQVHRGMMMIDGKDAEPRGIMEFEAEIEVFGKNHTSVRIGYEPVIHISNIKQAAKIVSISNVTRRIQAPGKKQKEKDLEKDKKIPDQDEAGNPVLRAGDKAHVRFRFCFFPACFEAGTKILFREGKTRGVGLVEKVISMDETAPPGESASSETGAKKSKFRSAAERRKIRREKAKTLAEQGVAQSSQTPAPAESAQAQKKN